MATEPPVSAAKAFTANGLSLQDAPISTAQLYPWVQPGAPANPLLRKVREEGNPVNPDAAYEGNYNQFGTRNNPIVGRRFSGADYIRRRACGFYSRRQPVGGLGLSGDRHPGRNNSTAWRLRANLRLAPSVPNDTMTLNDTSGHPHCPNDHGTQGTTRYERGVHRVPGWPRLHICAVALWRGDRLHEWSLIAAILPPYSLSHRTASSFSVRAIVIEGHANAAFPPMSVSSATADVS